MSVERTLTKHVEDIEKEISHVRGQLQLEIKRRGEAEEALRFYATPNSYMVSRKEEDGNCYQDLLRNDYSTADNSKQVLVAGHKARLHLKRYETD